MKIVLKTLVLSLMFFLGLFMVDLNEKKRKVK